MHRTEPNAANTDVHTLFLDSAYQWLDVPIELVDVSVDSWLTRAHRYFVAKRVGEEGRDCGRAAAAEDRRDSNRPAAAAKKWREGEVCHVLRGRPTTCPLVALMNVHHLGLGLMKGVWPARTLDVGIRGVHQATRVVPPQPHVQIPVI
jgi:hypothetical protein